MAASDLLEIAWDFDVFSGEYKEHVRGLLQKALPEHFFNGFDGEKKETIKQYLQEALPVMKWTHLKKGESGSLSITILMPHRINHCSFFYEMVQKWLLPQKLLNVELFFSTDFRFTGVEEKKFTLAEICVSLKEEQDFIEIKKNKRSFEAELRLGVLSEYHAKKILDFKNLPHEKKTSTIQEKVKNVIYGRAASYEKNHLSHVQPFLATCCEEFKSGRNYHHIARLISVLHLIRKVLKEKVEVSPGKRHLILKFLKTKLTDSSGRSKVVLGVLVGLNFLKEHEVFEKRHLLDTIKQHLPTCLEVENSFFMDRSGKVQTLYLEVERDDGVEISQEAVLQLKKQLPVSLRGHVEHLIFPVFMPRNEEEILRNIMALSRQLRYVHDIPQVMISFEEQSGENLSFQVIFLRVLKPAVPSVAEMLQKTKCFVKWSIDRSKRVGFLRRRHIKEASVLRLFLPLKPYVRKDHLLDLNRARQDVFLELNHLFGDIRDYNGGMISKQNEAYRVLKNSLDVSLLQNESLLEKFFYGILPVEMTVVIPLDALKNLFLMLLHAVQREETRIKKKEDLLFKEENKGTFVVIPIYDMTKKKTLVEKIDQMGFSSSELASFFISSQEVFYLGYGCFSSDLIKRKEFLKMIYHTLSLS